MSTTNVLITGANRGQYIRLAHWQAGNFSTDISRSRSWFRQEISLRPNHIVVGSVRDIAAAKANGLDELPAAEGSRLILVKIEAVSTTDPFEAVKEIQTQGIEKLDIVIANSAIIRQEGAVDKVGTEGFPHVLAINVVAPVTLFAATKPLLDRAENPKWLSVSSAMGSMDGALMTVQHFNTSGSYAYGASKAALNHVTRTIHVENDNLIAISIHPGYVGVGGACSVAGSN